MKLPVEIRTFTVHDLMAAHWFNREKISALSKNPFAESDAVIVKIAGFCGGEEAGSELVFPLLANVGGAEIKILAGSSLFVDPRFRRSGLGMVLPELMWQYSPSKFALGASLSQMALPIYQFLDYTVFLLPRNIMLWRSRSIVEMKLKGAVAKTVSFLADCCICCYSFLLKVMAWVTLRGVKIEEVEGNNDQVLEDVSRLISSDSAPCTEVHDVQWLKWHMTETFSKDGPLRLFAARAKGNVIGFYMTKKRFHEQASHRGFKNVWLGSVVEWQMKKGCESKLGWLLVHAALKLKKEGMDAVEIPSTDKLLNRFLRRIGWRQIGESSFVVKAGEGSPLFGDEEMKKPENWRLRPAMGDAGLS